MNKSFIIMSKSDSKDDLLERSIFLEEGFFFLALIPFIWLAYHRLWIEIILYSSLVIALSTLETLGLLDSKWVAFFLMFFSCFFALYATDILRKKYLRMGYSITGFTLAKDKEESMQKFLKNRATG